MKNEKISEREMTLLMANLLSVKAIFTFPRGLFEASANAAWLEVVLMFLIALVIVEISFLTYRLSGKRSVIDLSGDVGGKPLKISVSVIAILILALKLITASRIFSESVKLILLPKTEPEYIIILLAAAVLIAEKRGLSALSAVNAVFFPICLAFLGVIVVFLYKEYDINNLFPFFGSGIKSIASGAAKKLSCFDDILALNLLLPYAGDISVPRKSGRRALFIAFLVIFLVSLSYALCYPYPLSKEYLLPVYQLSKMVRAGEYFQRFEALFEFIWEISQLLYLAIYLFLICDTAAKGFGLADKSAVAYGTAGVIMLAAAEPMPITDVLHITRSIERVAAPIAYLLPIIIPLLYMLKKH